jgi:hypothetical protein
MDIKRLLKVYNYVNDPKKAKVNLKFIGLVAAFLLVGGLLVTFSILNAPQGPPDAAPQTRTDYVGLTETEAAVYAVDPPQMDGIIEGRLDNWIGAHPEAEILDIVRHNNAAGLWTGYDITYRE